MKKQIIDFIGSASYQGDDLGTYLWGNRTDGSREMIAVVYGYNSDTEKNEGKAKAELFQDELGKFIAEAINEKIKRDLSNNPMPKENNSYINDLHLEIDFLEKDVRTLKFLKEKSYSEEEVYHILAEHTAELFKGSKMTLTEWFDKIKKK
jgi:hypothetical protein